MSRATWIQLLLFLHIFGAIAAVGPTLTYGLLLMLGERSGPQQRAFAMGAIGWIDNHLATPAFIVQAGTGSALIFLERWTFYRTAWLLTGVGIYVVVAVVAMTLYAPMVRRQRTLAERLVEEPADPNLNREYATVAVRARTVGILVALLTVSILYFMIVKPVLWSAG
jgi:uncharacterized membrane protein